MTDPLYRDTRSTWTSEYYAELDDAYVALGRHLTNGCSKARIQFVDKERFAYSPNPNTPTIPAGSWEIEVRKGRKWTQ